MLTCLSILEVLDVNLDLPFKSLLGTESSEKHYERDMPLNSCKWNGSIYRGGNSYCIWWHDIWGEGLPDDTATTAITFNLLMTRRTKCKYVKHRTDALRRIRGLVNLKWTFYVRSSQIVHGTHIFIQNVWKLL